MTIFLNVLFIAWCLVLLVVGLCGADAWYGLRGEANGGSSLGRGVALICGGLMAVSVLLRVFL